MWTQPWFSNFVSVSGKAQLTQACHKIPVLTGKNRGVPVEMGWQPAGHSSPQNT